MTFRAVIIAILLSIIAVAWMHQASLIQAPGLFWAPIYLLSVPPVPAVFCLIFLVALVPLTMKLFGKALSKREMIFIYMVLVIAIPTVSWGVIECMLPAASTALYFATPDNNFAMLTEAMPRWFYPHDAEVVRTMYEGSSDGSVPWSAWIYPLAMWTIFMTILFFTTLCALTMLRKQWVENERLCFPLLFVPMSIVEKEAPGSRAPFFRNPLVWIAIGLVFLHHCLNIAHEYNPAVMALTNRYHLGALFTEYPWTVYSHLAIFNNPQVIGLAYFVPLDILFSGWFFHLSQSTLRLLSEIFGISAAWGFPHTHAQSAGAYTGMFLILLWVGRHEIATIWRKALGGNTSIDDSAEPMSHRAALLGTIGGTAVIVIWVIAMGVYPTYAAAYFLMVIGFAVVSARIRAEAGIPTMWGYFGGHARILKYFVGSRGLIGQGDLRNISVLTTFEWLSEGYFAGQMGYQIENQRLAEEVKLHPRIMPPVMMITFVLGCIFAYYLILGTLYKYGSTTIAGGTRMGGPAISIPYGHWQQTSMMLESEVLPDPNQAIAVVAGTAFTILLVLARWRWLRIPLHPIGYVTCTGYGYGLWGPFFVTWVVKAIVHRLGGVRLYRQLMPFFLGLAFGDLLADGISWIIMSLFGPEILAGYMVQFG